jgi:general L-amino acid transport system substrate-binding protein
LRLSSSVLMAALALASLPALARPAAAQSTLEKVKAQGYVRCGSVERPGLAQDNPNGNWSGLELEICHAVAVAVLGPNGKSAYHAYDSDKAFDAVRQGADQLSFLTFTEMAAQNLTDKVLPGPAVFIESHDLMVEANSSVVSPADLAGKGVCFMNESPANESVDAYFEERHIPIIRHGYQEDGEMYDGYAVQNCPAVAGESTTLADAGLDGGINNMKSRLLREHLATFPIVAATSLKDDAQWAAIVAWTIDTLKNADARASRYHADGLRAMPVDSAGLGLAPDWQAQVVASVGSYAAIFHRNLGEGSRLKLQAGLNAAPADGGALYVVHRE